MYFKMDQKFKDYFKTNLRQIFFYIIDDCNLRCEQCLYKTEIAFQIEKKEVDFDVAIKLLSDFREMGAVKLTLMGGEPTLYGIKQQNRPLLELIKKAKELGYEYVRIDTNGQFNSSLLEQPEFKMLDEITFSIDGPNKEINDPIRGYGSFDKCVKNIKRAKELGYNIDITACISKFLIERDEDGNLYLDRMIKFAEDLGIERINFHNLFKTGVPRDCFSGNLDISIKDWFRVWNEIEDKVDNKEYKIPVRIPQSFTTKEKFDENPAYYGYCSCKTGSRILIHPNGMLRVCSLMIGTPYAIARYYDGKIVWDDSPTNELRAHKMGENTPCTNQSKNNKYGEFVPVCVSFKPKQQEMIWKELNWENKRIEDKIRVIVADDNEETRNQVTGILDKINGVDVVATADTPEDTYNKIIKYVPEMVFAKYDFKGTNMNGLDIIKKSKETLNENVPAFNFIAKEIPKEDFLEARRMIGDKMNTIIREQTQVRYDGIINDYKDYKKMNV